MGSIITLTTDFGTEDTYVAVMKGVILNINPGAVIVDICHTIEPQNITQAAFIINTAFEYFPGNTIHLVIVDPGVGSRRRAVILKTSGALFVAPDNGVLSHIIGTSDKSPHSLEELPPKAELLELPTGIQAVNLTNTGFWHHPVSSTFHGRDIFAPVAAHLSLGIPVDEFGDSIGSIFAFPVSRPRRGEKGDLIGHILHIDRFGNLITDVKEEDLPKGRLSMEIGGQQIEGLSTSYIEGNRLVALIGSSGHLEIAQKNGSAALLLGAKIGGTLRIE